MLSFCYGEAIFLSSGVLAFILLVRRVIYFYFILRLCEAIKLVYRKPMVSNSRDEKIFMYRKPRWFIDVSLFLSFLLGSLGYAGATVSAVKTKGAKVWTFERYNADPPNGSNQSYCFLVLAIDRTYGAKQKDKLIGVV